MKRVDPECRQSNGVELIAQGDCASDEVPTSTAGPSPSRLAAILFNPALNGGNRTLLRVQIAARILGHDAAVVANVFAVPTRDSKEVRLAGRDAAGWVAAQDGLRRTIEASQAILVGWGTHRPTGLAGAHFRDQVMYVRRLAEADGKLGVWTVGGEARHPSRWHQYVSDRHGRATGCDFQNRLASVLTFVPLATLIPSPS